MGYHRAVRVKTKLKVNFNWVSLSDLPKYSFGKNSAYSFSSMKFLLNIFLVCPIRLRLFSLFSGLCNS
jgi:hypothetical protein